MKKAWIVSAAAALLIGSLSGCNKGGSSGSGTGLNSNTPAGDITVENNCYSAGLPIAKDTAKLKIMIKDDGGLTNYDTVKINKWMKDNLNIEVEWQVSPGGWEVNNMATLAYVSGNMPDIFMGMAPLGYSFHWQYIQEGKVQDLTDLIPKYGPNILKMFKEVPQSEYLSTGYDGRVYMLPMVRTYENDTGRFANQLYINQTWLDNLGLSIPTTTVEFKNVLRTFKSSDPNGNNIADEIPLSLPEDLPNGLYGAFGMSVYYDLYYADDNQQIHFAPVENNYRRALTYYRDLYKEGLIDSGFYNQTSSDVVKKINSSISQVGAFVGDLSTVDFNRAKEYSLVPPLTDDQGNSTWTNQETESMWPEWFVVTSACKYPEIAVRMADYFYSTEGSYVALYGPPGKDNLWYVNDDGKVVFTDPDNMETRKYEYTPSYPLPHYRSVDFNNAQYVEIDTSKITEKQQFYAKLKQQILDTYTPVVPKNVLYKTQLTLNEMKESNLISPDIDDYTWRKKFLMDEASLENDWDSYIANMKRLGVDDLIQIKQDSYDRYLAWMNS